jgi:hypothetical protein
LESGRYVTVCGDVPFPSTTAVPLLGGVRTDQESLDAFVSESVALSSLADQVVRVSSEVTFETGPVP